MTPINSEDKPTNSDYVALWQLQDIEETIQDASPEEMPELYDKLEALSSGLTEAIQKLITADRKRVALEARIDEVNYLDDNFQTDSQDWEREHPGYSTAMIPMEDYIRRRTELKAKQEEV